VDPLRAELRALLTVVPAIHHQVRHRKLLQFLSPDNLKYVPGLLDGQLKLRLKRQIL
jgi:hypothetical protein